MNNPLIDCPICEGDFLNFMKQTGKMCPGCGGSNKVSQDRGDAMFEQLFIDIMKGMNVNEISHGLASAASKKPCFRQSVKSLLTSNSKGQNGNTND